MYSYKSMYLTLFNAITDALEHLERGEWGDGIALLKEAQQQSEEHYIQKE